MKNYELKIQVLTLIICSMLLTKAVFKLAIHFRPIFKCSRVTKVDYCGKDQQQIFAFAFLMPILYS